MNMFREGDIICKRNGRNFSGTTSKEATITSVDSRRKVYCTLEAGIIPMYLAHAECKVSRVFVREIGETVTVGELAEMRENEQEVPVASVIPEPEVPAHYIVGYIEGGAKTLNQAIHHVYTSSSAALAEARRLSTLNKGREMLVFKAFMSTND